MNTHSPLLKSAVAIAVGIAAILVGACTPHTPGCVRVLHISNVSQNEGSTTDSKDGYTHFLFTVTSSGCAASMTARYTIGASPDSAVAGSDYVDATELRTFASGDMSAQTLDVAVYPDQTAEPDETFTVCLTPVAAPRGSSGSPASTGPIGLPVYGIGTILNDDGPAPAPSGSQTPVVKELHCSR